MAVVRISLEVAVVTFVDRAFGPSPSTVEIYFHSGSHSNIRSYFEIFCYMYMLKQFIT